MKSRYHVLCLLLLAICLLSCGEGALFKKNVSGVYIGKANLFIEEARWGPNLPRTTLLIKDQALTDTITVTAVDKANYIYEIDRETNHLGSFYDFEGELTLNEDYEWVAGYEYDKEWRTLLEFNPDAKSLEASIYVREIFEATVYDDNGEPLYDYVRTYRYSITAFQ